MRDVLGDPLRMREDMLDAVMELEKAWDALEDAARAVEAAAATVVSAAEAAHDDALFPAMFVGSVTSQAAAFQHVSVGVDGSLYPAAANPVRDLYKLAASLVDGVPVPSHA